MSREKGMIKGRAVNEVAAALELLDATLVSDFPATAFPLPFPTAALLYDSNPVPLTGGGFSTVNSLDDKEHDGSTEHFYYFTLWDAGWLHDMVVFLSEWGNAARLAILGCGAGSIDDKFERFGTGNAGYDRNAWDAGSVDRAAANVADEHSAAVLRIDAALSATAGRMIMGVEFPDFDFTTTSLEVLEDAVEHGVVSWTAGDPTLWQVQATEAKRRMDELRDSFSAGLGLAGAYRRAFRIWRHGSQTDGRGE